MRSKQIMKISGNFKIIILLLVAAFVLPFIFARKTINWEPQRVDAGANVFMKITGSIARFSLETQNKDLQTDFRQEVLAENKNHETLFEPPEETKIFTSPQKPYRILILGDSFMAVAGGFGDIIEQRMVKYADITVLRYGKVSSGLSRPDYFDWFAKASDLAKTFNPNVVIIMMGTNDAQSFEELQNAKKSVIVYGTSEWDAKYLSRVQKFVDQLALPNIALYWVGLPAMRDQGYEIKMRHVAALQEKAASRNIQAKFIPSADMLAKGGVAYQPFLPNDSGIMQATRNVDGIHLSYFGGTYLAQKIIDRLSNDLGLELKNADTGEKD